MRYCDELLHRNYHLSNLEDKTMEIKKIKCVLSLVRSHIQLESLDHLSFAQFVFGGFIYSTILEFRPI